MNNINTKKELSQTRSWSHKQPWLFKIRRIESVKNVQHHRVRNIFQYI